MKKIAVALACIVLVSLSTIQSGDPVLPPLAVDWKETATRRFLHDLPSKYKDKTKYLFIMDPVPCTVYTVRYRATKPSSIWRRLLALNTTVSYEDPVHGYAGIVVERTKGRILDSVIHYFYLLDPAGNVIRYFDSDSYSGELKFSNEVFRTAREWSEDDSWWKVDVRYSKEMHRRHRLFTKTKFRELPLCQ